MTTAIEYALMAGDSYISSRRGINQFPVPEGWEKLVNPDSYFNDPISGFEAIAFQRGTEIVISYAGTYDKDYFGDYLANAGLVAGTGSAQLLQAAEYYLQVKAANPGATITLTGHSLGGGLAALVGVFFGVSATTFDQAPFAQTALFGATDLKNLLVAKLDANGDRIYSDAVLAPLTDYIDQKAVFGVPATFIPNEGLVSNIVVQGEMLSVRPGNIPNRIGTTIEAISNTATGASAGDLHSQALLTAFLQSRQTAASGQALNEVTVKLPDLLQMIFDRKLFAHRTDEANDAEHKNLIDHLVRHEAGVQGSFVADSMVTRFTSDLWKLAQDGGLTLNDGNTSNPALNEISKGLIAFAMQKYYTETAASPGYAKEFFKSETGGISFSRSDVAATLSEAKGRTYFDNYLLQTNSGLTPDEQRIIRAQLPNMLDWFIQAGTQGMSASATTQSAFMLGGSGSDVVYASSDNATNDSDWGIAA
jgi:hypothetical protein